MVATTCTWFTDTDIVALRPAGGLGLTAEAQLEAKAQLARKKNLNPGCEAHFTFNRMTRPASGRIRWPQGRVARGSGPVSTSEWPAIHPEHVPEAICIRLTSDASASTPPSRAPENQRSGNAKQQCIVTSIMKSTTIWLWINHVSVHFAILICCSPDL